MGWGNNVLLRWRHVQLLPTVLRHAASWVGWGGVITSCYRDLMSSCFQHFYVMLRLCWPQANMLYVTICNFMQICCTLALLLLLPNILTICILKHICCTLQLLRLSPHILTICNLKNICCTLQLLPLFPDILTICILKHICCTLQLLPLFRNILTICNLKHICCTLLLLPLFRTYLPNVTWSIYVVACNFFYSYLTYSQYVASSKYVVR